MDTMSLGGLTSRRTGALVGWALAMASTVLSLPTLLSLHGSVRLTATMLFVGGDALASALLLLPWHRLPRILLLVWPLGLLATVAAVGLATPVGSVMTLSGLTIIAFFHVGQFQRRWTGVLLVPLAFAALAAGYGGLTHPMILRAPITVGVWVIVSESLGRLRHQAQILADALDEQARTDTLTGLATRRVLAQRLKRAKPGGVVVIIDIDHFKVINDTQGHLAGDRILSDLGALLLEATRQDDLAVRFGGEEFVLFLADAGVSGADTSLVRIRDTWHSQHPAVTFSAGIAVIDNYGDTTSALTAADRALYLAKESGRDRWLVAGAPMA
jgi:diguanylate cyclase (GGDEF)-like protein